MAKNGQWTWNYTDGDIWRHGCFDTKEEAIKDAVEDYGVEHGFWLGQVEMVETPSIDPDAILENLAEATYEEVGEVADDYLSHVKKEEKEELSQLLNQAFTQWAEKRGYLPDFYKVVNIERYDQ